MSPTPPAGRFRIFYLALLFCLLPSGIAGAETLSPKALELVAQAVFEVVVPKPARDSLEYKDPLPLNSIPITIRNDKYLPLGTAFAIGPRLMVSAAHVMSLGSETQFGTPLLRDQQGSLFEIDQIVKLSERRDFVVFTIKDAPAVKFFQTNTSPQVNQAVFAVGNALGEGVVIRDGLYTSATPEPVEGDWKWLRFSAAASPGNSGGPLLDREGRVVGLVLRKSPSENLNIALPIAEVLNAREHLAHLYRTLGYQLPVSPRQKGSSYAKFLVLPRSYQDLNREVVEYVNRFGLGLQDAYFAEMQDRLFPNGPGSKPLLHATQWSRFPQLFRMKDDGYWQPEEVIPKSADLGNNGTIEHAEMGQALVLAIHKPDNVSLEQLYRDDRFYMDLVLKGLRMSRLVGQSPIRITSLGPAQESYTFRDQYSRKWLVRTWLREFDDTKVVTFSLPTPDGLVSLMRLGQTGVVDNDYLPDLKLVTNFVNVSYFATAKEWREFLKFQDLLPESLAGVSLSRDDAPFTFQTPDFSLSLSPEIVPPSDKNQIFLPMGYGLSGNRVSWQATGLLVMQKPPGGNLVALQRHLKPDPSLNEEVQSEWQKVTSASFPYNRASFSSDGQTRIMDLIGNPNASSEQVYSVLVATEGTVEQKVMSELLEKTVKGVAARQSGTDSGSGLAGKAPETVRLPYREYSSLQRSDHPSAVRYALQGQLLAEKGEVQGAMEAFAKALTLDPRCAEAHLQRGLLHQNRGEPETAKAEYAKAVAYNPFYPDPHNNLGDILFKAGRMDEAMVHFQKALDLDPRMTVARNNVAKCLTEKGAYQAALKEYDRNIEQDPNDSTGYYNRGNLYRIMGDFGRARADLDRAIGIKAAPEYFFARGYSFQMQKEYAKAISDYTAALELDPRFPGAYLNRGNVHHQKGAYQEALADLSKAVSLEPSKNALMNRGNVLSALKRDDEALADYQAAIVLDPQDWNAWRLRGVAHGKKGNLELALADLNKAISIESGNADLYNNRGFTLFLQKDFAGALVDYERAIALDPLSALAFQNRGNLYAVKKEAQSACADWQRACELGACSNLTKAQKRGQCR